MRQLENGREVKVPAVVSAAQNDRTLTVLWGLVAQVCMNMNSYDEACDCASMNGDGVSNGGSHVRLEEQAEGTEALARL